MPENKNKVVVAGHICLDITPVFPQNQVTKIEEVLVPGKLVEVNAADIHLGGSVANTGLGFKVLGADVQLMGKIGKDSFGKMILDELKTHGIVDGMIVSEEVSTSYSVVLAPPGIDRIFLHHAGANHTFSYEDLDFNIIKEAELFHFGYPPLMKKMYENQGSELVKIFKHCKQLGLATSLDMAAVDASSEAGKVDWETILKSVLPYVDFFVPSIEELGFMLDKYSYQKWLERAGGSDVTSILSVSKDCKPLADRLIELGAKVVVIKCGALGMYYKTTNQANLQNISSKVALNASEWADKEGFEESYLPTKVLSATGAGDTSMAAFLLAMLQGNSLEQCLHFATGTGASCVASYDALSGLLSFSQLQEKIDAGWKKKELREEQK